MPTVNRRELLASVPIFSGLGERELDLLLEVTTTRRLKAKDVLFRKGDAGNQLYAVLSGRLKILAAGADGSRVRHRLAGRDVDVRARLGAALAACSSAWLGQAAAQRCGRVP